MKNDEIMLLCLKEAQKAYKKNEVPIGAVIVRKGKVIAKAYNNRQGKHLIIGHAEIQAILKASRKLRRWNLVDCELFVTLRPCKMCESVINQSRIKKVYYLLDKLDFKKDYDKTVFEKVENSKNEQTYSSLLSLFFSTKR